MDDLIERLRNWKATYRGDGDETTIPLAAEAATRLAEVEAAGNQLAKVAGHARECYLEHPYACYCGLEAAIEQWRSVTNPTIQQENQHE